MRSKSAAEGPQRLSLAGKLDMLPGLATIIAAAVVSFFTGLVRGRRDAPSLYLHVAYAILRKAALRLSPLQLQWINPTTDVMYARYARWSRSGIGAVESVDVGHGAKGHWIGDKNARNVLIWYHGGGFCLPANVGYFKFWSQLVGASSAAGKDLAVFALTYDLAPHERYPTQHRQAVEALRYILTETKRRPGEVLLGGDSAGGNMAIGVLSHLAHSHPAMEELKVAEPLAGLVVVAPWTSLDESHGESDIYYKGDLLSPRIVLPWARAFLGDGVRDFYTDASDAPSSWFEPFPVKHVLVTAGENECLMPIVEDLFAKMKAAIPSAELFVGEREAHVAPVFNLYVRDSTETLQGKKIKAWLREVL